MSDEAMDSRMVMTKATMYILDSWKLRSEEITQVLGLPEKVRARALQRFRSHEPFPDEPGIQRRADYILRIAGALRTTYPTNPAMGSRWLRQRHRRLGRTPLSLLTEGDESGLVAVLAELDCTFCWDLSGSKAS
jgi:hypothetical protein